MQEQYTLFESECKKAKIYVKNDMPIGVFHDFLMLIKGAMVEKMMSAHKAQVEEAKKSMSNTYDENEDIIV